MTTFLCLDKLLHPHHLHDRLAQYIQILQCLPLLCFLPRLEGSLGGHRQRRIAGDERAVAAAAGQRIDAHHAETVRVHILDGEDRRLALLLREDQSRVQRRPQRDQVALENRSVARLGRWMFFLLALGDDPHEHGCEDLFAEAVAN